MSRFINYLSLPLLCLLAFCRLASSESISNTGSCTIIISGNNNSVAQVVCPPPNSQPNPATSLDQELPAPVGTSISIRPGLNEPARLISRELANEFRDAGFTVGSEKPRLIYDVDVEPRTVGMNLDGPDIIIVTITERSTDPTINALEQINPQTYPWHNPESSAVYAAQHLYEMLSWQANRQDKAHRKENRK